MAAVTLTANRGRPARLSAWSLVSGLRREPSSIAPAWRAPALGRSYDVVIVGGGGHGLATAYYLARRHGVRRIAVLERGWLGGGNTGRNTQVVRSNYFWPESIALYDLSLRMYESLAAELNFNIMLSQRSQLHLIHSRHDLETAQRWVNSIRVHGVDAVLLDRDALARRCPVLDLSDRPRYPVRGAFYQPRSGIARHDAVAWGYARAADAAGVDIIQNCTVLGVQVSGGRVTGVDTSQGRVATPSVALTASADTPGLTEPLGLRLPIRPFPLQAMVTEPVAPHLDTVVMSPVTHVYISQSDRGEFVIGAGMDGYESRATRGSFGLIEGIAGAALQLMPQLSRLKLMRHWAGVVDVTPDRSPLLGATPVEGLYVNCGWGTGGFKAIPAGGLTLAHHIATGAAHPAALPFSLERFRSGRLIDEGAASAVSH